jgi:sugar (pentulose or hexulose) kinase
MADEKAIESILVADCGTVSTKLLLLEKVEATYRFVAQAEALTTDKPRWEDITAGITHALETLQQTTGRILFTEGRLVTPREAYRAWMRLSYC